MHLIIHYVRPHFRRMGFGLLAKLVGTAIELFIPYILAHILDNVILHGRVSLVLLWGGGMLLCSAVGWLFNVLANRNASAVARDSIETLRHDLFASIMHLSNRQIDYFTVPSLISRMTSDTYNIHRMIGMIQRMGVRAPILLIGGIAITLTLDPVLSGVLAAMIPLMAVIVFFISRKTLPMFSKLQRSIDDMVRVVRENASGVRVVRALSKTDHESRRFDVVNRTVVRNENRANITMGSSRPIMNILFNIGLVLVIVIGAHRVNNGLSEVGKIIAFMTYFTMMLNAVMGITRILTMLSNSLASAARIDEVIKSRSELKNTRPSTAEDGGKWHIEMDRVSFSYEGKENNLDNISFALRRGESLGIIGPTGSGKSTIISLLMRFYDVGEGSVKIDGRDVSSYELTDLRSRFGVVFQNDSIFRNTIEGNVRLGREIDLEQIERAVQTAQAQAYIEEAGGLSHDVDAHGANLSGGQRQRLLIARALAGQPDVLILDDSSSALDYRTDALLRTGLKEQYADTTSIIVAQRISSIKHCDRIMVLDEGEMCAYGTHEELLAQSDIYREIYELQMGEAKAS